MMSDAARWAVAAAALGALAPAPAAARGEAEVVYRRGPLSEEAWSELVGREVLLVLSTGYRVCGEIVEVSTDVVRYVDPEEGERRAARSMVTAVHERSWECERSATTTGEWALPGAVVGLSLAGLGLVTGVVEDAGGWPRAASFAVLGGPSLAFGAPIAALAGRSAARDRRVRGLRWARISGWAAYGGSLLCFGLWAAGSFGEVSALEGPGLASAAGGLGAAGAGLFLADALRSRRELREVRALDSQPQTARRGEVRVAPLVSRGAVGLAVGGRF